MHPGSITKARKERRLRHALGERQRQLLGDFVCLRIWQAARLSPFPRRLRLYSIGRVAESSTCVCVLIWSKFRRTGYLSLIDDVFEIWKKKKGAWGDYLRDAGLDLAPIEESDSFHKALLARIDVNFRLPGLEDFCGTACRGIEPGDPARSLLYHVFASPGVQPDGMATEAYPTPAEIQTIENLVYGIEPPSIEDLRLKAGDGRLAIVVFAYEYVPAGDTVHKRHADLCFSRTGVARVGNAEPHYREEARGFYPYEADDEDDKTKVHVIPCRYAAFIAAIRKGNPHTVGPEGWQSDDENRNFWIPLHKLFNGGECLDGFSDLKVELIPHHVNEKLRRLQAVLLGEDPDSPKDDGLAVPPYRITKDLAEFDQRDKGLLVPAVHDPLVDYARKDGLPNGDLITFRVPDEKKTYGSLQFPADRNQARHSPELVHIKHELKNGEAFWIPGPGLPELSDADLDAKLKQGGYQAVCFVDYTADGWIGVTCPALAAQIPERLAAYSLIGQPDFFPLVKQQDLYAWWETAVPDQLRNHFWGDTADTPKPMSQARYPANLTLNTLEKPGPNFDSTDDTLPAIVGLDRPAGPTGRIRPHVVYRESTLSYRSTGVFEPGWDCSLDFHTDPKSPKGVLHLANYGLGSPFPEDTLICAAAGSFWPAAPPDITRFFRPDYYPTVTPILDSEAKFASLRNPKVENGVWEGTSLEREDWVELVRTKKLEFGRFAKQTLDQYIARSLSMAGVFEDLGAETRVQRKVWAVLEVREALGEGSAGDQYIVSLVKVAETPPKSPPARKIVEDSAIEYKASPAGVEPT